jgi:hypothetical protein
VEFVLLYFHNGVARLGVFAFNARLLSKTHDTIQSVSYIEHLGQCCSDISTTCRCTPVAPKLL